MDVSKQLSLSAVVMLGGFALQGCENEREPQGAALTESVAPADWDDDDNGSVTLQEWKAHMNDSEAFQNWDEDRNNQLTTEEFRNQFDSVTGFDFDNWDLDNNGILDADETGEGIYNSYDSDGDGVLNVPEFTRVGEELDGVGLFGV